MRIHVVESGETLTSIGATYGLSPERIAGDNGLNPAEPLVVGQTLVMLFPLRTYTVQEGDRLEVIAATHGVSMIDLLRNNPAVSASGVIYPGQTLVLEYAPPSMGEISTNGYVYPFVNWEVLRRTLPYLTYLTVFTYGFTPEGGLIAPEDEEIVKFARSYGVGPVMHLSTLGPEGVFSSDLANGLLQNKDLWGTLLGQITDTMEEKGYVGLDVDFEFLPATARQSYVEFIAYLTENLNAKGYFVTVALPPKSSQDQPGLLYEGSDYKGLGEAADNALLMAYEWGYTYGPAMAVSPMPQVQLVTNYALTQIPPEKLLLGMPNYGYDFTQPYVRGESRARSIGNPEAVDIARREKAEISYDEINKAPYFFYTDDTGQIHEVWFQDARSVNAEAQLIAQKGLSGQSFWNLMRFFPQGWLVLNSQFKIRRVYV